MKYAPLANYIGGSAHPFDGDRLDVYSPLDGSVISTVPMSDGGEVDAAVKAAAWRRISLRAR